VIYYMKNWHDELCKLLQQRGISLKRIAGEQIFVHFEVVYDGEIVRCAIYEHLFPETLLELCDTIENMVIATINLRAALDAYNEL